MSGGESASSPSGGVKELKAAEDVLAFWFGDEDRLVSDPDYMMQRNGKWWGMGTPDQDFIDTQVASKELIAKAANDELKGRDWDGPRGALAKLLLLDQFPRTASRGTSQAFAHDEKAAALAQEVVARGWDQPSTGLQAFHRTFIYVALMHSEKLEAQDLAVVKSEEMYAQQLAAGLEGNSFQLKLAKDHRAVIAKFGRYPHRNAAMGRVSTTEEEEWLNGDDLPMWAKSQMVIKADDAP